MKTKLATSFVLGAYVVAAAVIVAGGQRITASPTKVQPSIAVPSVAPAATPGPAPTDLVQALPSLPGGPLLTPEQVLAQALEIDRYQSTWEHPWSVETSKSEPRRITIKWFPSRTAESGRDGTYGPGIDAAAGPVWRVTIQGHVHVEMLTMNVEAYHSAVYDGVTYVIAQNSGALLSVNTGALVAGATPITTPTLNLPPSPKPYP